jgi:hypothetical protein
MPNPKDLYDAAVARIKVFAEEHAGPRAVTPLLKDINRYVVELRRDRAALNARVQELQSEVQVRRRELERHGALAGELAVAQSRALNLERRNLGLDAALRDREAAVQDLQERLRECQAAAVTGESTFTLVKVKCLACSLHFALHTWAPQRHTLGSLTCPECGQHAGCFLLWAEPGPGRIVEHVPGKAPLVAVGP